MGAAKTPSATTSKAAGAERRVLVLTQNSSFTTSQQFHTIFFPAAGAPSIPPSFGLCFPSNIHWQSQCQVCLEGAKSVIAARFLPNNGNDNLQLPKLLSKDVSGDLKVYKALKGTSMQLVLTSTSFYKKKLICLNPT